MRWAGRLSFSGAMDDPQYHAVVEVIAAMKSNNGSVQSWIKDLESALDIEEITYDHHQGRAPQ